MQIKKPSLNGVSSFVFSEDEALDTENEDFPAAYERFKETGDVEQLTPFVLNGQQPAIWELQPIRGKAKRYLMQELSRTSTTGINISMRAAWDACALALTGVTGAVGADGKPLEIVRHRDPGERLVCVTDEVMCQLEETNDQLVNEIGIAAIMQMLVPPK